MQIDLFQVFHVLHRFNTQTLKTKLWSNKVLEISLKIDFFFHITKV